MLLLWSALAAAATAPNVVLIVADDLGYGDLSGYGSTDIYTPNLDQLAAQGVRFDSFYAAPVCQMFRAGLLTGSYAPRVSLATPVIPNRNIGLARAEITIAELLKSRGYATGAFGKWHLGDRSGLLPTSQGFDEFFGLPYSNDMWPYHPDTCPHANEHPRLVAARQRAAAAGFTGLNDGFCFAVGFFPDLPVLDGASVVEVNPDQTRLNEQITERALSFIDRNQDRPFFLYLPFTAPHVPLFPAPAFAGTSVQGLYGDVVQELDWRVEQVLARLDALGLGDDTLVIFVSDNGPWLEYGLDSGDAGPLRDGKGSNFEGGIRVPMIMRWPNAVAGPSTVAAPVSHVDIYPTIAALAGAALPTDRVLDGRNIAPLMLGQTNASPHPALFFYGEVNDPDTDQSLALEAMRSGNWKLHLRMQGTRVVGTALYNLNWDISESRNQLSNRPGVVQSLVGQAQTFNDALRANRRPYGIAAVSGGGLAGSASSAPGSVNLTSTGSADWVHWGHTNPASVNRKAGGGAAIGALNAFGGTPARFQAPQNARVSYAWSDGTPLGSATTTAGLYLSNVGSGYSFTAPASPTARTLTLYLGGWRASGELEVRLSDDSAAPYRVTLQNSNGVFDRVVTVAYSAASSGQAVEVRYTMTGGPGNVTLSAAALQGGAAPGNRPPVADDDSASVSRGGSVDIDVLDGDVDPDGNLDPNSVVAAAPSHGTLQPLAGGVLRYTHDGGSSTSDSFTYTVEDTQGLVSNVATVSLSISGSGGGSGALSGTAAVTPATTNLTQQGSADWAHWGYANVSSVNRKSGGGATITSPVPLAGGPYRFQDPPGNRATYDWTDGTPTSSASSGAGLYFPNVGNGFTLSAPAGVEARTLKLYLGGWRAGAELVASLSDASATSYRVTVQDLSGVFDRVVTLTYRAASSNQRLNVRYTMTGGSGNVTLSAAALQGGTGTGNQPPVADDDSARVTQGSFVDIDVLDGDVDPEGDLDPSSVTASAPGHGTVQNLGGGILRYTHDGGPTAVDSFTYTVRDGAGALSNRATVTISIDPASTQPMLAGEAAAAPDSVNLTHAGISDWVHWGLSGPDSSNRRVGTPRIGILNAIGPAPLRFQAAPRTAYVWTNGTPTSSANTRSGLYTRPVASGFTFTAPADTATRTLTLYLGGWQAAGRLVATLSDGSTAPYQVDLQNTAGPFDQIVTLTYRAGAANQTLSVRYTMTGGSGNVTLAAAALAEPD